MLADSLTERRPRLNAADHQLQRFLGRGVTIVTSGEALARQVEHALSARDLSNPRTTEGDYRFLCTGDAETFRQLGTRFLQLPLGPVDRVEPRKEIPA